jgi:acyl-CoA synthetase (AMP-forming)/AMP-acid ligase II
MTAGAPPAAATIEAVEDGLGWTVTQAYGLTETSPFITICEPRPEHGRDGAERAAIKARQGVELVTSGELKVVDAAGNDVPRDGETQGEIVVRGNAVMAGYFDNPEATAHAMEGGWFHTGDAAVVHPDGYAEIRDRLKDVIISGGENISSVEVEAMLLRHPAVMEAAVVGLPDGKWGEAPHAFIVLKPDQQVTGPSCGSSRARTWRTSRRRTASRWSRRCRRRRRERFRSTCCAEAARRSLASRCGAERRCSAPLHLPDYSSKAISAAEVQVMSTLSPTFTLSRLFLSSTRVL